MPRPTTALKCPHCGQGLTAFEMPENAGWEQRIQWACFNDECPYYREGWDWMWQQYEVKASYRYRIANPETGHASPLPVWSETALRDRIIEDDGGGS